MSWGFEAMFAYEAAWWTSGKGYHALGPLLLICASHCWQEKQYLSPVESLETKQIELDYGYSATRLLG